MKIIVLLALLIGIGAAPGFANIINNGGFEVPDIGQWYVAVNSGQTTIQNWTVTGTSVDIVNNVGPGGDWAHSGSQAIDLAGTPGPGGIEQPIWTNLNEDYTFSFWASSNGGAKASSLLVGWNGSTIATVSTPAQGTWQQFTYTVQGTGSLTTVSLMTPIADNAGPLVDDVNVTSTPEPATLGLFGSAMVGLGLLMRKRSSQC
jgi:hypothetical protein